MAHTENYGAPDIHPSAEIAEHVRFGEFVEVQNGALIEEGVRLGGEVSVGAGSTIGCGGFLDANVVVGPNVTIRHNSLIMAGAKVCPDKVKSKSSNARELGGDVIVGPGVKLHNEVELGYGAIVPTQRTIAHIGSFGDKNRIVTIYGSDDGPLFSVGCQMGIDYDTFKDRVGSHEDTEADSANTYDPYLDIFNKIGHVVQTAYDGETALIEDLKAMHREVTGEYRDLIDMTNPLVLPSGRRFSVRMASAASPIVPANIALRGDLQTEQVRYRGAW